MNLDTVWDAAESLSPDERLELAARLLDSVPADGVVLSLDDPNLGDELQSRLRDTEGGMDWAELRRSLESDQ